MEQPSLDPEEHKPPILGKWKNLYGLVLIVLVALILIFYAISNHYS